MLTGESEISGSGEALGNQSQWAQSGGSWAWKSRAEKGLSSLQVNHQLPPRPETLSLLHFTQISSHFCVGEDSQEPQAVNLADNGKWCGKVDAGQSVTQITSVVSLCKDSFN